MSRKPYRRNSITVAALVKYEACESELDKFETYTATTRHRLVVTLENLTDYALRVGAMPMWWAADVFLTPDAGQEAYNYYWRGAPEVRRIQSEPERTNAFARLAAKAIWHGWCIDHPKQEGCTSD